MKLAGAIVGILAALGLAVLIWFVIVVAIEFLRVMFVYD